MRTLLLIAALLAAGSAMVARSSTPTELIESRQTNLKAIGKAMKSSAESFKSGAPDPALIRANAMIIASYADKLGTWFPAGTGMIAGGTIKTEARPEIWTDPAGFAKAANDFSIAAKAFGAAAEANDLSATATAMKTLGGTCKSCHESFRAKD